MGPTCKSYDGPERRRRRMYVTRNTEYHLRDGVCVAVRDRTTEKWQIAHRALHQKLACGVRFCANGTAVPSCADPDVGEALYFARSGQELVTSMLCGVERPAKDVVAQYPVL